MSTETFIDLLVDDARRVSKSKYAAIDLQRNPYGWTVIVRDEDDPEGRVIAAASAATLDYALELARDSIYDRGLLSRC